ncbi:retinoblastoma binding protein, putative [Ricinus communis]|uniref:Retinoblastoma binding protein, putative n=1 Tax=Ricinus communis TaxID=3988 RepID=B9RHG1_RICCO|nr:retinoblastoma binding protein, putative [Ricinus communis]
MKGNEELEYDPKSGFQVEIDVDDGDAKYVSKYSAILVATIQEAKDRISQIEYVFCNQLYSHFQFQSKCFQKMYLEAKKEADDLWKDKEKDLLIQIDKLKFENQQVFEENRCLKLEKDSVLSLRERNQQIRIDKLEQEVRQKSKEVDEGMELQNRLLQLVQTKSSMALEKGKQLKEREEKIDVLLAKVNSLEKEVEELKGKVEEKMEKVAEKKELAQGLYKNIELLMRELAKSGESLSVLEKEKKNWEWKTKCLEDNVTELKKNLGKKMEEVEEGRVLRAELLQQIDMNKTEILKQKKQLEESENEKELLMEKINVLEEKINAQNEHILRSSKVDEGEDSEEKLLQQIDLKDSQLMAVKKSHRDLLDKYKRLKSQYNYLCNKSGLTEENMIPQIKIEDENFERKHADTSAAAICEMKRVKIENEASDGLEDDKTVKAIPMSSFQSPTSSHIAPKCPPTAKSAPVIGTKRPTSRWIETRSHQRRDGPDPHDDFLDTPLENLKGTLNKATKGKAHDLEIPVQNLQPESSDDETQDMNVDPGPEKQQVTLPVAGQKAFKYVEPVRKKAERKNLQGVECKQCKKFYDAVLPDGGKDAGGNNQNFRCEHHDDVSRHRYKYIPPMTPEGFWNIGFESEM